MPTKHPPDGPRLLWIKTELLHPVDKGGKIRTIEMLRRLKKRHRITYLTLDDGSASADDRARAEEYCHELICIPFNLAPRGSIRFYIEVAQSLVSPLPYAIGRYRSPAMQRAIAKHAEDCDVVVSDFLVSAVNMPTAVPRPTVLFQHNVEAEIWRRYALNQSHRVTRLFFMMQWQRMGLFERRTCHAFDSVIAVSENDGRLMQQAYGVQRVDAVPTGVDTEFFRPTGMRAPQKRTLVFTGSMDWMPNEDAVRWFAAEIMPLVAKQVSDVRLVVVGRNPSVALKELAAMRGDIVITGRVEDVRPFIEEARCYVVPIRIGGGTRLKIFEAMAMEKPVVSTKIGAEGLPLTPGTDLLIADSPQSFAAAVVEVLMNDDAAAALGARAAAVVREKFGWDRVAERFSTLCVSAANSRRRSEGLNPLHLAPGVDE